MTTDPTRARYGAPSPGTGGPLGPVYLSASPTARALPPRPLAQPARWGPPPSAQSDSDSESDTAPDMKVAPLDDAQEDVYRTLASERAPVTLRRVFRDDRASFVLIVASAQRAASHMCLVSLFQVLALLVLALAFRLPWSPPLEAWPTYGWILSVLPTAHLLLGALVASDVTGRLAWIALGGVAAIALLDLYVAVVAAAMIAYFVLGTLGPSMSAVPLVALFMLVFVAVVDVYFDVAILLELTALQSLWRHVRLRPRARPT